MKEISIDEVKRLAALSALKFSEEELKSFLPEFNNILDMLDQIEQAEVKEEFKYTNIVSASDLREDIVKPSLSQELALKNAPKQRKGCYNVPKVVD